MVLYPGAAFSERLWMSEKFLDLRTRRIAEETVLNGQNDLRNNLQIAVHEHVERMGDNALGGILDGNNSVVCAVLADFAEDVGDRLLSGVKQAGAEAPNGGLVREGGFGSQIRDRKRFLERKRAGHDLAINGAQRFIGHRAGVQLADPMKNSALAMRSVDFFAGFEFDFADGKDMPGALVKKLDDLRVQLVDRFAMFGDGHQNSYKSYIITWLQRSPRYNV